MPQVRPECYSLGENAQFSIFGCGEPTSAETFFHLSSSGPSLLLELGRDVLRIDKRVLPEESWSHVCVVCDGKQRRLQVLLLMSGANLCQHH